MDNIVRVLSDIHSELKQINEKIYPNVVLNLERKASPGYSKLEKWIDENSFESFDINSFFVMNPQQRKRKGRIEKYLSYLCSIGKIYQVSNNKFVVRYRRS